ncbi:Zinc/iron permease [Geopyxis carbonaria]|nr:Zinc/iron permease [Geopyxis carbonaria]
MQSLHLRHGAAEPAALSSNATLPPAPSCGAHDGITSDYDLKLHVAALFIILATSGAAAYGPLYFRRLIERQRRAILQGLVEAADEDAVKEAAAGGVRQALVKGLQWVLWAARHFGTGIIIGTAFIHLLPGAHEYLTNPCLPPFFTDDYPALPEAISMAAAFAIFAVDFGCQRSVDYLRARAIRKDAVFADMFESADAEAGESAEHALAAALAADRVHFRRQELLSILIVEAGICFHSLFIGLSLALTTGQEFTGLLIAIVFHQMFEGLAIGGRLATVNADTLTWRDGKLWLAATLYAATTPAGIAIGIAVRRDFDLGSAGALVLVGTFDSVSAGLLLYGGLVGLLSRDFHR